MTEEHKITVEIAGHKLNYNAKPELEQFMRRAAQNINASVEKYNAIWPGKSLEEKLASIAFSVETQRLQAQARLYREGEAVKALDSQLEDYLKKANNR